MLELLRPQPSLSVAIQDGPVGVHAERLVGTEAISGLFRFQLTLLVPEGSVLSVPFDSILGKEITVSLSQDNGQVRYWHGLVRRLGRGQRIQSRRGPWLVRFHAELVPRVWLLTLARRCRIFQDQKVPAILEAVLKGFTFDKIANDSVFPKRECSVQYAESDFAYASRLMEDEGVFYFFKYQDGKHVMTLGHTSDIHPELQPAPEWKVEQPVGKRSPANAILTWRKDQQVTPARWVLWDYACEKPSQALRGDKLMLEKLKLRDQEYTLRQPGLNGDVEVYEYPGGFGPAFSDTDRQRRAELRMQEAMARCLRVTGRSTCPQFNAGYRFQVSEGSFVLTRVKHVISQPWPSSGTHVACRYENRFACIPVEVPYRPRRRTRKPVIAGPQTAVVVGDTVLKTVKGSDGKESKVPSLQPGQEAVTDKYGRIRIQFHWDRQGATSLNSSGDAFEGEPCLKYWDGSRGGEQAPQVGWVRVAQPLAGRNWGFISIPRIGQEVLVGFAGGDPDRPMVLGSLYNENNRPPFTVPGDVFASGWKTHSAGTKPEDQLFNGLAFNDTKGQETLHLQGERNLILHAKKDLIANIKGDWVEQIAGDRVKLVGGLPGFGGALDTVTKKKDEKKDDGKEEKKKDEPLWEFGPLTTEAKLPKEFEISYGIKTGASVGWDAKVDVGAGAKFSVDPTQLVIPAIGPVSTFLSQVFGTFLNTKISLSRDIKLSAGYASSISLGTKAEIELDDGKEAKPGKISLKMTEGDAKVLNTLLTVASVLVTLGLLAPLSSNWISDVFKKDKDFAELAGKIAPLGALGIGGLSLAVLILAQLVVRIRATGTPFADAVKGALKTANQQIALLFANNGAEAMVILHGK